ncbi:MAG: FMN-binding protein [Faecalibacterium sp.]|jgi:uncharacterized protein with FMN-binding domain|nr:FMN-binding protein [Faecalibacterium sp.]
MKHTMIRNSILMALAIVVMGIILGLYIQGTGPMPRVTATTYTSTQRGVASEILVTVTVKDGKITGVTADVSGETKGYGQEAGPVVCQNVLDAGTCVGVDGVSGATGTSKAVLAGVQDCMVQAGIWDSSNAASAAQSAAASASSVASSAAESESAAQ